MKKSFLAFLALLIAGPALAQSTPFVRQASTVSISASTTSANAALAAPTSATTVWVCNSGSNLAYVGFGDSTSVATNANIPIPAGLCGNISTHGKTYISALAASGTTTVTATPGTGILVGSGGGGGGSGGGGTASSFGSAFPATGTAIGLTNGTNMVAWSATSNYGTAPSAIAVPAVNAFVTGAVGLAQASATSGQTGSLVLGRAENAEPTAVTNGQAVAASFDLVGKQITSPFANKENYVKGTTAAMTGTTSTQVVALVASQKLYITAIHCNNSSSSVPTLVSIQDGSGGAVLDTLAANDNFGGEDRTGSTPLFWTTAGNGLYAADVTTGASVICQASGYSGT